MHTSINSSSPGRVITPHDGGGEWRGISGPAIVKTSDSSSVFSCTADECVYQYFFLVRTRRIIFSSEYTGGLNSQPCSVRFCRDDLQQTFISEGRARGEVGGGGGGGGSGGPGSSVNPALNRPTSSFALDPPHMHERAMLPHASGSGSEPAGDIGRRRNETGLSQWQRQVCVYGARWMHQVRSPLAQSFSCLPTFWGGAVGTLAGSGAFVRSLRRRCLAFGGGGDVVIALPRFARPLLLLRGIILFRTYDGHKNEVFPHFLHTEFGSDYYVPP